MGFNIIVYKKMPNNKMQSQDDLWNSNKYVGELEIFKSLIEEPVQMIPSKEDYNAMLHGDNIYYRPLNFELAAKRFLHTLKDVNCNEQIFIKLFLALYDNPDIYILGSY